MLREREKPNCSNSQVLSNADSLSLPSEPPDIRNWFSSYAYESPVLNTNGDYEDSAFRVSNSAEAGVDGGELRKENEENLEDRRNENKDELLLGGITFTRITKSNKTDLDNVHSNRNAIQVLDSSDSLSLSADPPNIARWFSGYVYESPALDTSIDFSGFVYQDSERDRAECSAENSSKEKENYSRALRSNTKKNTSPADEKISSLGLVMCYNSIRNTDYDLQCTKKDITSIPKSKLSSIPIDLTSKKIPGRVLRAKPTEIHDTVSTQHVKKPKLDDEVFIRKEEGNKEAILIRLNANGSSSWSRKSPEKSVAFTCGSSDKENDEKNLENGFISSRKNRTGITSDAIPLRRSMKVQSYCLRVGDRTTDNKESVPSRKPLSETTNFQHIDGLEITGKWKCPQKGKPNLGPPLKQLRLERWVNRR